MAEIQVTDQRDDSHQKRKVSKLTETTLKKIVLSAFNLIFGFYL